MLIGETAADRHRAMQWTMFQMGGVGPMFGQLSFFAKFAGAEIDDPRPRERYVNECKRLLTVLDGALEGRDWIVGPYTIADIAIAPWLIAQDFYGARVLVDWADLRNVPAYEARFFDRPAARRRQRIPDPG